VVLEGIPRGTDAEDRAAVRDVVQRRGHIGEYCGMAMRDARDKTADANLLRERRVRRLELPALEVRSMEIPIDRVEVVPHPERIEPEPVHEERVLAQRLPRGVLRPEVDSELHGQAHPVSTLSPCSASRATLSR